MPGLFGIISKRQKLSEQCLLNMGRRMADSMRRVPWLRAEIWGNESFCGGSVHLGVLNPEPQPLTASDQSTQLWFDGEYLPRFMANDADLTAEKVCELVSGCGSKLGDLDGVFNLACFNSETKELVLANDRLGFRPLYYTETDDWFAYSGEVKALLAIRDKLPELDEISLRQFFSFDHMLGERTWWKGIELIPPASLWRISANGLTCHQYWTFDDIRSNPQEEADVQVEFSRLWSEDVRRRVKPGTMPILLSGGQDSRLLVAELRAQGADLVAITFGSKDSPDMKIARRVAATAGVRHRPCYLNTENWWQHREEAIWQTDGLINAFNFQAAIAMNEVHTGNWYSLVNIAGDLLFGGSHLDGTLMQDWRLAPENLLIERYIENPFFSREEGVSASVADVQRYAHGRSPDCFHLHQRMRRFTLHGPGCLAPYCEIVFPGVSYALLQLMLGCLSDGQRSGHKFYNRFLATWYPQYYGDIPWQVTGRGLAESLFTKLSRAFRRRLLHLLARKGNRISPDQWFVNYPECVSKSRIREKLLQEDLIADQFLGGAARRALADGEIQPLRAPLLVSLLTFETYLRRAAGMPSLMV